VPFLQNISGTFVEPKARLKKALQSYPDTLVFPGQMKKYGDTTPQNITTKPLVTSKLPLTWSRI
jgi:hypothetical protein